MLEPCPHCGHFRTDLCVITDNDEPGKVYLGYVCNRCNTRHLKEVDPAIFKKEIVFIPHPRPKEQPE